MTQGRVMPLYDNAPTLILDQLRRIADGERVGIVEIGELTVSQFAELVRQKREMGHEPPASRMLVYLGRHHYDSRVRKDGYLPCDLVRQLEAALASTSVIETHRHMTAVVSTSDRDDGHGNKVRDRAILELQARKPRAEVYSVVPKRDFIRPKKQQSP
ncbi:hypothetical protein BAY15_1022 [Stenotrophomonas rhizophila]|nr:hypothetical protein BAY15_1022 [Stenotrophomonas rhizophila]